MRTAIPRGVNDPLKPWPKALQFESWPGWALGPWLSRFAYCGLLEPDHVLGVHLNMPFPPASVDAQEMAELTDKEKASVEAAGRFRLQGSGYFMIQSSRPQTLAYGLTDAPAGQLAWIAEKFKEWTDSAAYPEDAVDRVQLLTNVSAWPAGRIPVDELAARLGQRFRLLTGGSRAALPRQHTLRATMQFLAVGEADALHDRHAVYFLALAEHTESAQSQLDSGGWTDHLALEQADLDAALDWFMDRVDTERALRLAGVLWHLWEVHGFLTEGRPRIAALLALPGADAPTLGRARVLNGAGVLALNQYDAPYARRLFRESLALYRGHQHDRGVAWVLIHLSWLCIDIARRKAARRFLRDALARCERLGDQHGIARCQNLRGYFAWAEGDLHASRDLHQQSLTLNRELGDRWGTAWALHRPSVTLLHLAERGEVEAPSVRPLIEEGLAIWQELGERRHFAFAFCDLGAVATLERDFELACRWLAESHAIFAELNDRLGAIWVLGAYQLLLATAGHLESALCVRSSIYALVGGRADRALVPFQHRFERQLLLAGKVLGTEVVATAWAEGQAMSLPEAIAYAQRARLSPSFAIAEHQRLERRGPSAPIWVARSSRS